MMAQSTGKGGSHSPECYSPRELVKALRPASVLPGGLSLAPVVALVDVN